MIEIRRITTDDPLFVQARRLRQDVLLGPLGLTLEAFDAMVPGLDERAEHYVGVLDHPKGPRVVGCALLDASTATVAQVAVDPQRQGEGLGKRLLATVERRAFGDLNVPSLSCEAHVDAVGFYERLGWAPDGEPTMAAGVPHQRMVLAAEQFGPIRPSPSH